MQTYEILKKLRRDRGMNAKQFCKASDISYNTYQNYETGKRLPTAEFLMKIADFYGVSVDFILGRKEKSPVPYLDKFEYTNAQKTAMALYSQLPDYARPIILEAMKQLVKAAEEAAEAEQEDEAETPSPRYTFPRLSRHKASAGTGFDLDDDDSWDEAEVYEVPEVYSADFAVEVDGDSMEPIYSDGDILLVKSTPTIDIGEVGIFTINGNGYVKKLGRNKLISYNTNYKAIILHEYDTITCWGRVIGKTRKV
jgi:phage repressor protein C with HTH and peptisase S24 domain/DNA-binding XRE family transcriptional regulator